LPGFVVNVLGLDDNTDLLDDIEAAMDGGHVPLVARYELNKHMRGLFGTSVEYTSLGQGHMFLAVRLWRFGDLSVVVLYDPNLSYSIAPVRSLLFLTGSNGNVLRESGEAEAGSYRYFVVPGGRLSVLLSASIQQMKDRWRDLLETTRGMNLAPR